MAQSGYTPILIYASGTAAAVPSAANLTSSANGAELALNYADGKLYYKNSAGTVTLLADKISVSVASANGFAGSVSQATATSTPAITLSTSVTGVLVGNGTAVAAAVSGTDFKTINSTSILGSGNISITTSPGGSTTQVQYNNAGAFGGSANFVWDNSNVRLGIGTSSPSTSLHVVGSSSAITATVSSTSTTINGAPSLKVINTGSSTTNQLAEIQFRYEDGTYNANGAIAALRESGTARGQSFIFAPSDSLGNAAERMRIDSAGSVGIGVTPSAWNTVTPVQVKNASFAGYSTTNAYMLQNAYYASGWKYISNGAAARFEINGSSYEWSGAASGTAGNAITFTPILTVDKDKTLALQGATSATGIGIAFPATQSASSNANTLDDYEEGTWTVTTGGFTVTGTTTLIGTYTKIGRVVFFDISFANTGTIAYGVSCLINLPFIGEAQGGMVTMRVSDNQALQTSGKSGCQINIDNNAPQPARIFPGNFTTTSAGETLYFSGFYRVS